MHPPLYQAHPLCRELVDQFVQCHKDNPVMKFLDACGAAERTMNACFREEKELRRRLNRERGNPQLAWLGLAPAAGGAGAGGGGASAAEAANAATVAASAAKPVAPR